MDAQSLENLKLVYPDVRVRSFRLREDIHKVTGYWIRITRGYSGYEAQAALYAQGRSLPGKIVTNARPGLSLHNFGLAFDVCFLGLDPYLETMAKMRGEDKAEAIWEQVAKCVEGNGMTSGRRFRVRKDSPHAQMTYGLELNEVVELYHQGGLAGVWTQCDKIRGASGEWNPAVLPKKEDRYA